MKKVGFDAIDIHMGHGYLLSQFISPLINKRKDEYGGTLKGRMKLILNVVEIMKKAVGNDISLWAKINLADGVKGGIDIA